MISVYRGADPKNRLYLKTLGDPMEPNISAPVKPLVVDDDAEYTYIGNVGTTFYVRTAKAVGFTDFNVENVVTLVARPESLIPVSLVVTKHVTGTVRSGGKTSKMYQLEVKSQRYTY